MRCEVQIPGETRWRGATVVAFSMAGKRIHLDVDGRPWFDWGVVLDPGNAERIRAIGGAP
jgi:hypothetical protein